MDDPRISLISTLYYEKGLSQQKISSRLGISKMTVSRYLQRAKEMGLVEIRLQKLFTRNQSIEQTIQTRFHVPHVYVVAGEDPQKTVTSLLGRFWAYQMNLSLSHNQILGLGLGSTVAEVCHHLLPMKMDQVEVVQLLGGLSGVTRENPFDIVQELCRKLKAKGTYLASLATVKNRQWRDQIISQTAHSLELNQKWTICQQAIFGIGTLDGGVLLGSHLVTDEEVQEIKEKGGVGDVLGHAFDNHGHFLQTRLEERLVSIPVDLFQKIPERIAVGGGPFKAKAIKGLLKTGFVTTLVTDEACGKQVIEPE